LLNRSALMKLELKHHIHISARGKKHHHPSNIVELSFRRYQRSSKLIVGLEDVPTPSHTTEISNSRIELHLRYYRSITDHKIPTYLAPPTAVIEYNSIHIPHPNYRMR
jgi:hypothetical protein